MIRSFLERSTLSSSSRVSFAISRLAAPEKSSHSSYISSQRAIHYTPSIMMNLHQHRNYSFTNNLKNIFKKEVDKNKDLKESLEELKKVKEQVVDTKIAQDVINTANVTLDKGKGFWTRSMTYISSLNIGTRALKGFEKTSDTVTDAVSNLKDKKIKFYPGQEEQKVDDKDKTTTTPPPTNEDPMAATTATAQAETTTTTTTKAQEPIKADAEHFQATQEATAEQVTGQEAGPQETAQEAEKEKVYDIVPVAETKKRWFSLSHSSSLAKTVERIRIYHPNFSIVDFMNQINPVHRDFLVALYTQDVGMLGEIAVPDFVEKIKYSIQPLKPGEQSNKCHVIELYDAELDSTDPERVAIKVTFEAQIVVTTPEGKVIDMALDRSDSSTQVTQLRGAFEWIFEEKNIMIHDFTVYTMEPIY